MIGGRVLDASTLVGFALVRPYPQALVWTAVEAGMVLAIPATALAEAWARTPPAAHDALEVLLSLPNAVIEPLGSDEARQVGIILARITKRSDSARPDDSTGSAESRGGDLVRIGQVIASALRRGWPIVTGEAEALRLLVPTVDVDELP